MLSRRGMSVSLSMDEERPEPEASDGSVVELVDHAELEIPELIQAARQRHPGVVFTYAWPFADAFVARFLQEQITAKSSK